MPAPALAGATHVSAGLAFVGVAAVSPVGAPVTASAGPAPTSRTTIASSAERAPARAITLRAMFRTMLVSTCHSLVLIGLGRVDPYGGCGQTPANRATRPSVRRRFRTRLTGPPPPTRIAAIRDLDVATDDGRLLCVREDGDPHGVPVVTLHGNPGSRTLPPAAVRFAQERGIRLIRYDRPGFGASTPAPGRRVVDAVDDVRAILDALGVETFAVEGSSAGGPHALAVAALLADRVSAAAVSASLAPIDGAGLDFLEGMAADDLPAWRAAMEGPDTNAPFVREAADWWLAQTPATFADAVRATGTDADVVAVDAETASYVVAHVREAFRTGADGYRDEDHALAHPWAFEPGEVRCPTLVWHGEDDHAVPRAHGRWLAARIPDAEAHFAPGCGHMSCVGADHIALYLGWLLARSG